MGHTSAKKNPFRGHCARRTAAAFRWKRGANPLPASFFQHTPPERKAFRFPPSQYFYVGKGFLLFPSLQEDHIMI